MLPFCYNKVYNAYNFAQPYGAYLIWSCALTTDCSFNGLKGLRERGFVLKWVANAHMVEIQIDQKKSKTNFSNLANMQTVCLIYFLIKLF